jgi:hypothetical protein
MRAFEKQEVWEMKPRKLTIEETEHPEMVIDELFQYATFPQFRWHLLEATKSLVTGTFGHLNCRDRSSLIDFYEQLERLIEVSYLLHERYRLKSGV